MRKTELFKYVGSEEIKTFEEIQNDYIEEVGAELPIPYDEMHLIIMLRLVQNGGNIVIITDDVLAWCNEYADFKEAERYLSQEERNISVRDIYSNIIAKDEFVKEIEKDLVDDEDADLYNRLQEFLKR